MFLNSNYSKPKKYNQKDINPPPKKKKIIHVCDISHVPSLRSFKLRVELYTLHQTLWIQYCFYSKMENFPKKRSRKAYENRVAVVRATPTQLCNIIIWVLIYMQMHIYYIF